MSNTLIILLVVQLSIDIFIAWKLYNYEKSRLSLFVWSQEIYKWSEIVNKDLLRLKRSLTTNQAQTFASQVCQDCDAILPENTARTHDGLWLCQVCKAKRASM